MLTRLQKLIKLCKRDVVSTGKKYKSHGEKGKHFTPIWGVIIPHDKIRQGAYSKDISEYNYALEMAMFIPRPWSTRDKDGIRGAVKELLSIGCNASLEPHKNAFNTLAKGFEILVMKDDTLSLKYAELIADNFKQAFPDRILRHGNGIKIVSKGDRGYNNLFTAKKHGMEVALLSEAFFIDNPSEWIPPRDMGSFWSKVIGNV